MVFRNKSSSLFEETHRFLFERSLFPTFHMLCRAAGLGLLFFFVFFLVTGAVHQQRASSETSDWSRSPRGLVPQVATVPKKGQLTFLGSSSLVGKTNGSKKGQDRLTTEGLRELGDSLNTGPFAKEEIS